MAKSTHSSVSGKPEKPFPGFPLFPHASGRWAKKIRQRTHFFGRWAHKSGSQLVPVENVESSAAAALEEFNRQWPYLSEGRTPPPVGEEGTCTVKLLCNSFLTAKRNKLATRELAERSFRDYFRTCDLLVKNLKRERRVDDLRPDDFEKLRMALADGRGPVALWNEISRMRMIFKYALDQRLIDRPVHYGQSFNRPSATTRRRARQERGVRMFQADELRKILTVTEGSPLYAMVLLGINGGLGQSDCANLKMSHLDLDSGWLRYPRPKTGVDRSIPLWPETVEAVKIAVSRRPQAKDAADQDCVFITKYGHRFVRTKSTEIDGKERCTAIDAIAMTFRRVLSDLGITGNRNFYAIRHTFQTIGGESKDPESVSSIMGHVDSSMAGLYRERISDERLRAVVAVVREWLWPDPNRS